MKKAEQKENRIPIFSERFKELKGNRTQQEFSDFLGISRPSVGFYEVGTRIPDISILKQISDRCGVSADWLLGKTDVRSPDATTQSVCKYTGLSDKSVDILQKKVYSDILSKLIEYGYEHTNFLLNCLSYIKIKELPPEEPITEDYQKAMIEIEKYGGVVVPPHMLATVQFEEVKKSLKKTLDRIAIDEKEETE